MINVGNFATVNDNTFEQYEVPEGTLIYVAGDAVVAVSEEDPYALRRIFVGCYVKDDVVDITRGGFTIDGNRLTPVDEERQAELEAIHKAAYPEAQPIDTE